MKITDKLWEGIWGIEKYPPISKDYISKGFGTDEEPLSSLWLASFAYCMGQHFKENVVILDYGCGSARFINFTSCRLRNFSYYGLEKPYSKNKHGENAIKYAGNHFGHDYRVKLGFVGSELEKEAIFNSQVVSLMSVFTHTTIEETESIIEKLYPIVKRGGVIVFSMILSDTYETISPDCYGFSNTYGVVYNTMEQIENLKGRFKCIIEQRDTFITDDNVIHSIFIMHKK